MSEFVAPQIIYVYCDEFGHAGWTCCEDIDDARMRQVASEDTETHYAGAICVVIASDAYDEGSTGKALLRALGDPETRLIDAVKAAL